MTLKEARRKAGLTQERLAAAAGVRQNVISRLESGNVVNPTFDTVVKIAEALGIDPRVLEFGRAAEATR